MIGQAFLECCLSSSSKLKIEEDDEALVKVNEALIKMIQYHAKKCLEGYIFTSVSEIEVKDKGIPIYGFWLSFVLLATDHMNIVLKTHFDYSSVQPILKKIFRSEDADISQQMAESFINEYSNLFGTKVKNTLFDIGISTGMSLPVLTRGFDNYLFEEYFKSTGGDSSRQQRNQLYQYCMVWGYETEETKIYCSVEIDIMSQPAFEKLKPLIGWDPKKNTDSMVNNMEFLL